MNNKIKVAITQMACSWDAQNNIHKAEQLVRAAASEGAQVILLQELFETPYFCIDINLEHFSLATDVATNPAIQHFRNVAKELEVVLPISFYERAGTVRFNSIAIIDADGEVLGVYRKTHIPDTDGYLEKYYFSPGDTGFKVWNTKYAKIGVGICWDQWFPEAARDMTLQGAELLLYPTAIGSEPKQPEMDSMPHWQRVMQGHSAANQIPVIASNRVGLEKGTSSETEITFFGSSFITDNTGEKVQELDRSSEGYACHVFDLKAIDAERGSWGIFRDRVPNAYRRVMTMDGVVEEGR
ncbi:N-carbamoylputrescine amidase [Vibrio sp. CK2-1]|uniref:N-carbamoylputrescine amidase n=1 Tax=Vibrio sp. CK2-1 TaxID=2912249 RepID=UPI001F0064FC|nr:N-carbamoylputrescine amidase [Vibrio sp. CK2-1]MCF7354210.1 N-carbamoylputrescine amidase [Vibrio sp. CK2-1]